MKQPIKIIILIIICCSFYYIAPAAKAGKSEKKKAKKMIITSQAFKNGRRDSQEAYLPGQRHIRSAGVG